MLRVGAGGLERLREEGSAKLRMPAGSLEAILINTGGGLAGGDRFAFDIAVGEDAALTITSQAAERVYRSLGDNADVDVSLTVGEGAALYWLPQETILFDGAALQRTINARLGAGATLLAVESVVLGRIESGETVRSARLRDRWRIWRGGELLHGEDLRFDGVPPVTAATLGPCRAFASVVRIGVDAETQLDQVRRAIGDAGAASAWNGKLVARMAAKDGFMLRKALVPALSVLAGGVSLPKVWSL
jgi:urease accessory protein